MFLRLAGFIFLLCLAFPACAILDIEVTGAGEHQTPVSIAPFAGEDSLDQRITERLVLPQAHASPKLVESAPGTQ